MTDYHDDEHEHAIDDQPSDPSHVFQAFVADRLGRDRTPLHPSMRHLFPDDEPRASAGSRS